jgi:hypothetical protein
MRYLEANAIQYGDLALVLQGHGPDGNPCYAFATELLTCDGCNKDTPADDLSACEAGAYCSACNTSCSCYECRTA